MNNMVQMMQKAQQFKQRMQQLQEEAKNLESPGNAGGLAVTCRMNGRFELTRLKIDPTLMKPGENEVLEDLVIAAVNDARKKSEKLIADETKKLMQELGLPTDMDAPL